LFKFPTWVSWILGPKQEQIKNRKKEISIYNYDDSIKQFTETWQNMWKK